MSTHRPVKPEDVVEEMRKQFPGMPLKGLILHRRYPDGSIESESFGSVDWQKIEKPTK